MDNINLVRAALVSVLNSEARARLPPLWPLSAVKYPAREIKPVEQPDGFTVKLVKRGYAYKAKGPRPRSERLVVDPVEARIALNALLPNGFYVSKVEDFETHITITITLY